MVVTEMSNNGIQTYTNITLAATITNTLHSEKYAHLGSILAR